MTTTTIRRAMTFLLVIGMMLAGTVVPAFAVAMGSASLTNDVFFAGSNAQLDVTVSNTAPEEELEGLPVVGTPEGSSIDAVQILVDPDAIEPTAPAPPEGWTGDYNEMRGTAYYFATAEQYEISPGDSLTFSLPAAIGPQSEDTSSSVIVQVSDDGGETSTNAGVLGFDIKILEVIPGSVTIVKPVATQAPNLVTEQQDNADIQLQVKNHADVTKSVTATASKDGGSSSFTTPGSDPQDLLPGETDTFTLDAVFGAPGSLSIKGEATTTGGTALEDVFSGITVQQAISLAYNNDLDPLAAVPGTTETFTLSVAKSGGPGGSLGTTFTIRDGSENPSDSATLDVGANNGTGNLSYTVAIPLSILDGEHPSDVTYSGTDDNGAIIDEVTLPLDDILLDRLQPILELELDPPTSSVAGAEDAAGAGDSVGVSGTVEINDGDGGQVACGQCDIIDETVTFLDADGESTGSQAGPNLTNSNGTISGSFTMPSNVPAGTVKVRLTATALRAENLLESTESAVTDVDIIAPLGVDTTVAAEGVDSVDGSLVQTGRDADGDFIDVPFSELVGFPSLSGRQDWGVDGNVVESVEYVGESTAAGTGKVRLRLAQAIDRNATPVVTYSPAFPVESRAFDRVDLSLADQVMDAVDNIAPDVLGIVSVSTYRGSTSNDTNDNRIDQGAFDGIYYTRDKTPVVRVNNVTVGDTVRVFNDIDGDGVQEGGEATLGTLASAPSETSAVTLNDLGDTERLINISAYAIDAAQNAGAGSTGDQLQLDFTSPTITDFTRSGTTVTVQFSEVVPVGRDAAFDWLVLSDGRWRPVDAVTSGDDDSTRELTLNSLVVPGDVDAVRWESVTEDTSDDYADIARNEAASSGLQYTK